MNRYLVIADDFTGANDTGVQISRRGIPVGVVFSGDMIADDSNSYVIDTESRPLPAKAAADTVGEKIRGISFDAFDHIIKKVDSTLRGAIGAEIAATADVVKPDIVLFAPALPDLDRTTEKGIHKLKGTRITQTEMARDPRTPVTEDNITEMLAGAFGKPVKHFDLDTLRNGGVDFSGYSLFTADAVLNSDLEAVARAARAAGKRVLWVGTAAIADVLLSLEVSAVPALAVIASLSGVSSAQLHYATDQGANLIAVPVDELLADAVTEEAIAARAVESLRSGRDTLLASGASIDRETAYAKANAAGAAKGLDTDGVSRYTQQCMGRIARLVLEGFRPSGVFLTGGDTAISFLEHAGCHGSLIQTEIAVGIPLMRLRGGPFDLLKVVTKAGAFGKEDAIAFALRKLKEVDY